MKENENIKPIDLMPHKDNIELPYKDNNGNYHPSMESVREANERYKEEMFPKIEKGRSR